MTEPAKRLPTTAQRGRLTAAEKHRLEHVLPGYQVSAEWFKKPPKPLEVELGMGNGLALLERAKAAPDRHFLGCEIYQAGIATLLYHVGDTSNISIYSGDARDLLAALPNGSVGRLLLPHPDPWPKARHHKRRILNTAFLDEVARVLETDGEFWFITDWPDYAEAGLEVLKSHGLFSVEKTKAPDWWVPTKYQLKAAKAGREATFILAER